MTIGPQLQVHLLRFLTLIHNDIELAALSGQCFPTWVSLERMGEIPSFGAELWR